MPVCKVCDSPFPNQMVIEGKARNLQNRRYCLSCSPFGQHNTRRISKAQHKVPTGFRECFQCQKTLPLNKFYRRADTGGLRVRCIACVKEYWKESRNNCMQDKIGKIIAKYGKQCMRCDRQGPFPIFDFHHLQDKDLTISRVLDYGWSRIELELSKCIMLCACCHRIEHYDETAPSPRAAKNRLKKSALIQAAGGKCKNCCWTGSPVAFDFHHRDPSTKSFKVSQRLDSSYETLLTEIGKCDLLCACCHRLEHVTTGPLGTRYLYATDHSN